MGSHSLALALVLACCLVQFLPASQHIEVLPDTDHQGLTQSHSGEVCRETYNYKNPHPCTPTEDCAFVVRWRSLGEEAAEETGERRGEGGDNGGWAEYHVMAALSGVDSSSVWMALGFSSNSDMGDTDVIACWHNAGNYSVHDGFNVEGAHKFVMDTTGDSAQGEALVGQGRPQNATVALQNASIQDGIFRCTFQRKVNTSDVLQDKVLSEKHFVLVAVGPLEEREGHTYMAKHVVRAATTCACHVTTCSQACSCPGGFFYQMLKLHGIVMSICFMFLIPTGAILSRYYKTVFIKTWFKAHVTIMTIGVLWSLVGLGLVLTHTRGVFSVGVHQILGIVSIVLAIVQPMVGLVRPENTPTPWRKMFNIFHRIMAVTILLSTTVALFWGVYMFHNSVMIYMIVVVVLFVLLNLGFVFMLELLKKNQKFSSSPPVGYHKVKRQDDLSESEEEEEVYVKEDVLKQKGPAYRFEKGLLLLFVVQNLVSAGMISAFIFYFEAEAE